MKKVKPGFLVPQRLAYLPSSFSVALITSPIIDGNQRWEIPHLDVAQKVNQFEQEMWALKGLCWRFTGDDRAQRHANAGSTPVPAGKGDHGLPPCPGKTYP